MVIQRPNKGKTIYNPKTLKESYSPEEVEVLSDAISDINAAQDIIEEVGQRLDSLEILDKAEDDKMDVLISNAIKDIETAGKTLCVIWSRKKDKIDYGFDIDDDI